jgi:septum site-determining protein MinC
MISESTFSLEETSDMPSSPLVNRYSQIYLKPEGERLLVVLPDRHEVSLELPWSETWQELKHLLQAREQSWQEGTQVSLVARDYLLDTRQLLNVAETLAEAKLCLTTVNTSRRQTAVAAATSGYCVEQNTVSESFVVEEPTVTSSSQIAEPLYLQNTIRSGVEISHPGTIVIFGDLNPGGKAIAAGDIFVWGRLRGVAHAGAQGNRQCRIVALQMEFTQLRIADAVARAPQLRPKRFEPELAFVTVDGIRLTKTLTFAQTHHFLEKDGVWVDKNHHKSS